MLKVTKEPAGESTGREVYEMQGGNLFEIIVLWHISTLGC